MEYEIFDWYNMLLMEVLREYLQMTSGREQIPSNDSRNLHITSKTLVKYNASNKNLQFTDKIF
jgi:hypothetical protein